MRARVLFFGMLRDLVGRASEDAELAPDSDLRTVFDHYAALHPRLRDLAGSIVMARNQEFADLTTPLQEGDEIAFLPPVSGGAAAPSPLDLIETTNGPHYFALTRHTIDTRHIIARLLTGAEGAVVTF